MSAASKVCQQLVKRLRIARFVVSVPDRFHLEDVSKVCQQLVKYVSS
jgi:hypothetical protein